MTFEHEEMTVNSSIRHKFYRYSYNFHLINGQKFLWFCRIDSVEAARLYRNKFDLQHGVTSISVAAQIRESRKLLAQF
jgi:hypothetical protein